MNNHINKAFEMLEAARPASGFRPQTESEWAALQAACVELGFAMCLESGMSKHQARQVAQIIYGGQFGRHLLDLAYKDDDHA
jgi:hypothetical protein